MPFNLMVTLEINYHSSFIDNKTEAEEKLSNCPKFT